MTISHNRPEKRILRKIENIRGRTRGFTGLISDLGGPAANMGRSGRNRLKGVSRSSGQVFSLRSRLRTAFLRYHDADNWSILCEAPKLMGRAKLS